MAAKRYKPGPPLTPDDSWSDPKPDVIPPPTYWPAVLAFGLTLLAWSALANYPMGVLAMIIIIIAFVGWVRDLYND